MSTPKKPVPSKSKISKKPAVKFEMSEDDLDKASGGSLTKGVSGPLCENANRPVSSGSPVRC
jgi:hypothetical protein